MNMARVLTWLMSAEACMATIAYLWQRDWKHAFYWGSATCINVSVNLL